MKPLVSVLIPSLRRFDKLLATVKSFYETADDPSRMEIIVRLHETDDQSIKREMELHGQYPCWVLHGGDKPANYDNAWLWNQMRPFGHGIWHQYWSDDMTIEGKGWDTQLSAMPTTGVIVHHEFHQLNASVYQHDGGGPVPFLPGDAWSGDFTGVPDAFILQEFNHRRNWPVKFLAGITVNHQRRADSTLPVA